jgi:hypothetical protein
MAGINRTTGKATDLITFSRASGGTALRKISYGSELVTNGTFDSDTGWTKGAGWTISGGAASNDGTINAIYQPKAIEAGKLYACTVDITFNSAGVAYWRLGNTTNIGVMSVDETSYTQYLVGSADGNYIGIFTNTNITIDNISVKEVLFDQPDGTLTLFNHPNDTPRIEYDAAGNVKGLLIEEARTNRFANSITFSDWVKVRSTISDNTDGVVAPDGSVAKVLKCDSTASNTHSMQLNTTNAAANSVACASIMVKKQTTGIVSHVVLRLIDDAAGSNNVYAVAFDLSTGEVTATGTQNTVTAPFYSKEDVGNGWFRLSIGFTKNNTAVRTDLQVGLSPVGTLSGVLLPVFSGDGASGVYIYGVQLEEGSFPTSYIPTSGATATRAADIASISVDNFGYNQKAGTFVADYTPVSKQNQYALAAATPSGASEYLALLWGNSGNEVRFQVTSGGATSAQLNTQVGTVAGARTIHAGAYKTNDFAACNNGGSVLTDTVGDAPSGLTIVWIGEEFGNYLNGHIKSIAYYPRRLSNAQLQELTA